MLPPRLPASQRGFYPPMPKKMALPPMRKESSSLYAMMGFPPYSRAGKEKMYQSLSSAPTLPAPPPSVQSQPAMPPHPPIFTNALGADRIPPMRAATPTDHISTPPTPLACASNLPPALVISKSRLPERTITFPEIPIRCSRQQPPLPDDGGGGLPEPHQSQLLDGPDPPTPKEEELEESVARSSLKRRNSALADVEGEPQKRSKSSKKPAPDVSPLLFASWFNEITSNSPAGRDHATNSLKKALGQDRDRLCAKLLADHITSRLHKLRSAPGSSSANHFALLVPSFDILRDGTMFINGLLDAHDLTNSKKPVSGLGCIVNPLATAYVNLASTHILNFGPCDPNLVDMSALSSFLTELDQVSKNAVSRYKKNNAPVSFRNGVEAFQKDVEERGAELERNGYGKSVFKETLLFLSDCFSQDRYADAVIKRDRSSSVSPSSGTQSPQTAVTDLNAAGDSATTSSAPTPVASTPSTAFPSYSASTLGPSPLPPPLSSPLQSTFSDIPSTAATSSFRPSATATATATPRISSASPPYLGYHTSELPPFASPRQSHQPHPNFHMLHLTSSPQHSASASSTPHSPPILTPPSLSGAGHERIASDDGIGSGSGGIWRFSPQIQGPHGPGSGALRQGQGQEDWQELGGIDPQRMSHFTTLYAMNPLGKVDDWKVGMMAHDEQDGDLHLKQEFSGADFLDFDVDERHESDHALLEQEHLTDPISEAGLLSRPTKAIQSMKQDFNLTQSEESLFVDHGYEDDTDFVAEIEAYY